MHKLRMFSLNLTLFSIRLFHRDMGLYPYSVY